MGDIVIDGDDILGDGVNVAARLEGLAEPGGVCISDVVHQSVAGKLDLAFEDLGEQQVKNISKPIRAYRAVLFGAIAQTGTVEDGGIPLSDKPSIAVLPFDNLSNDPEQEFFSDGITEDLITDLSKMSGLFVIARNTAFSFKGQSIDVGQIGRKLGVAHVLEGSVRKAGNRVRINAQLIETATGGHVWADRYDGSLDDIFAVQDEITNKIVAALQIRLTAREAASARRHITDNVEAYELYLKGRAELLRLNPEGTSEALRLLEQAIAIDTGFAAAYAILSRALQHGWTFMFPGFEDSLERMLEMAKRAAELDDTMGLTHAHLGWALNFAGRHDEAIASFERAIALEPNAAEHYIWFCESLNYAGDPVRGLEMIRRSMELDPVVAEPVHLIEGHSLYLLRDYDAAIVCFNTAIALAPGFPLPHLLLGIVYSELGRSEEATSQIATLRESLPAFTLDIVAQRLPYRDEEPRRRLRNALEQAGMPA